MRPRTAIVAAAIALAAIVATAVAAVFLARAVVPGKEPALALSEADRAFLASIDGTLSVAADPGYAPFDFVGADGQHEGMAEDMLRLVERALDTRFLRASPPSWTALLADARATRVDIVKCLTETEDRSSYLLFTRPYISVPTVIVTREGSGTASTLDGLAGKRVAVTRDYNAYERLKRERPEIVLVPASNDGEALGLVAMGSVDAALSDLPAASWFTRKMGLSGLRIAGRSGYENALAMGVRRDMPGLARILDAAIASIPESERQGIVDRWLGLEARAEPFSGIALAALGASLVAALAVILVLWFWEGALRAQVEARTAELKRYDEGLEDMVAKRTEELTAANAALVAALANVKTLKGLLPMCARCKKIRDDTGYWNRIEEYLSSHSEADFSHGLCPECARDLAEGLPGGP